MPKIKAVIFRRTIRASYASLDLLRSKSPDSDAAVEEASDAKCDEVHIVALVQFHPILSSLQEHEQKSSPSSSLSKDETFTSQSRLTSVRSFIRRLCKLGSEVELTGNFVNGKFQVELAPNSNLMGHKLEPEPASITSIVQDNSYSGVQVIQTQQINMISCQKARERYYPTFDKINKSKTKTKTDVHNGNDNGKGKMSGSTMSKKKKKETDGETGHGGGIGKRMQGELIAEFLISLIARLLQAKVAGTGGQEERVENHNQTLSQNENQNTTSLNDLLKNLPVSEIVTANASVDDEWRKKAIAFLNGGSGVLDVAGGNGHVSLAMGLRGIKSTVVDPRETVGKLPRRDRKVLRKALKAKKYHIGNGNGNGKGMGRNRPNEINKVGANESNPDRDVTQDETISSINLLPPPIEYASYRAWFVKRPDGIDEEFREGTKLKNNQGDTNGTDSLLVSDSSYSIPICSVCSNDGLVSSCSAIVALHPDEATGDIVEYAVQNRIPFVVVPCCVFSRLFPMRFKPKPKQKPRTPASTPGSAIACEEGSEKRELVSTYEDLIEYLVDKDENIEISKMNFGGANIALWNLFDLESKLMTI